jgi:hypothetical protein
MRQIRGGDTSQSNRILCDQIIKLCETQRSWLSLNPRVIATVVYTYLRVIADHRSANLQALQQKEIRFVISLIREKVPTRLSVNNNVFVTNYFKVDVVCTYR